MDAECVSDLLCVLFTTKNMWVWFFFPYCYLITYKRRFISVFDDRGEKIAAYVIYIFRWEWIKRFPPVNIHAHTCLHTLAAAIPEPPRRPRQMREQLVISMTPLSSKSSSSHHRKASQYYGGTQALPDSQLCSFLSVWSKPTSTWTFKQLEIVIKGEWWGVNQWMSWVRLIRSEEYY